MIRGEKTLTRDVIQHSRRRAPFRWSCSVRLKPRPTREKRPADVVEAATLSERRHASGPAKRIRPAARQRGRVATTVAKRSTATRRDEDRILHERQPNHARRHGRTSSSRIRTPRTTSRAVRLRAIGDQTCRSIEEQPQHTVVVHGADAPHYRPSRARVGIAPDDECDSRRFRFRPGCRSNSVACRIR